MKIWIKSKVVQDYPDPCVPDGMRRVRIRFGTDEPGAVPLETAGKEIAMIEIQLFETDELEDLLREVAEWVEAEKLKEVIDVVVFYSYEYGDWNAKVYYRARNK